MIPWSVCMWVLCYVMLVALIRLKLACVYCFWVFSLTEQRWCSSSILRSKLFPRVMCLLFSYFCHPCVCSYLIDMLDLRPNIILSDRVFFGLPVRKRKNYLRWERDSNQETERKKKREENLKLKLSWRWTPPCNLLRLYVSFFLRIQRTESHFFRESVHTLWSGKTEKERKG